MDKYEYNLKLEEIDKLVDQGDYKEAADLADTIEWKRVRNIRTLCLISEIYEAAGRLQDSKKILQRAYKRSPVGKNVLYRLVETTTALQQYDEALEYYTEYVQAAPHDNNRYILKYKLYKGRGSSAEELISILEEYLGQEYTERWAYELAKLYRQAGQMQKCLAACDDLVLWFHSGKYVQKALELKKKYASLTPKQQQIYEECIQLEAEEELEQERSREKREEEQEEDKSVVVNMESTDGEVMAAKIIAETEKEIAEEVTARKAELERRAVPEAHEKEASTVRVQPIREITPVKEAGAAANPGGAPVSEEGLQAVRATAPEETETRMAEEPTAQESQKDSAAGREVTPAFDQEKLQIELAKSMREIVSGVARRPEIPDEDLPASVEERLHMTKKVEIPSVPEQKVGRLSIDDVLLSMGDKGQKLARQQAEWARQEQERAQAEALAAVEEQKREEARLIREREKAEADAMARQSAAQYSDVEADATTRQNAAEQYGDITAEGSAQYGGTGADVVTRQHAAEQYGDMAADRATQHGGMEADPVTRQDAAAQYGGMTEDEEGTSWRGEAGRRKYGQPVRTMTDAAAEELTDAQREALQYTSHPEKLLRNKRSLPTYVEEPDVSGNTKRVPDREELIAAARKEIFSEKTIRIPEEVVRRQASGAVPERTADGQSARLAPERAADGQRSGIAPERAADMRRSGTASEELSGEQRPGRLQENPEGFTEADGRADMPEGAELLTGVPGERAGNPDASDGREFVREAAGEQPDTEAYGTDGYEEQPADEGAEDYPEEEADADQPEEDYLTLPEHLRHLFSGFTEIPELEDQIANAIIQAEAKGAGRTSKSGNILIFGAHGSGKTTLAMNIAKAIAQDRGSQVVKMAKVYASDLNKKDIAATIAKIAGGTLIVEEAGDLDDNTVDQLTTAMEFRTDGLIIILEDEQKYVHELLMRHPRFTMKFTAQIYIPDYTADELLAFGQVFANAQDYVIGEDGLDALYEKLVSMMDGGEEVTIKEVTGLVEKAIQKSNGFLRKMTMGKKRFDENDYIILFAKDFR